MSGKLIDKLPRFGVIPIHRAQLPWIAWIVIAVDVPIAVWPVVNASRKLKISTARGDEGVESVSLSAQGLSLTDTALAS